MREALDVGQRALASGDVPVGALVLDRGGQVMGRGWNSREATGDPTAHAEVVALREASAALGSGGSKAAPWSSRWSRARCARARWCSRELPAWFTGRRTRRRGRWGRCGMSSVTGGSTTGRRSSRVSSRRSAEALRAFFAEIVARVARASGLMSFSGVDAASGNLSGGGVSERPKEHASKACEGATPPWVQIPPPPLLPRQTPGQS